MAAARKVFQAALLFIVLLQMSSVLGQYYMPVPVPVPVPQPYGYGGYGGYSGGGLPYGGYSNPIGGYSRTSVIERRGGILG
ncbi:prisilkin-39-like [Macrosteles quadrilineatus]|uniref:prisilkin-39-like n=1 Tax=Macrosteles quadrilineatus TaxID=74068 RepID=UPI0023E22B20|nr:prisilkin-39-like [Macrosteles quadrilineatus]